MTFSKMAQKGGEFVGTEVSPFLVPIFFTPGEELVERLSDGELVSGRKPSLGCEIEDEAIDLILHENYEARQPGQFCTEWPGTISVSWGAAVVRQSEAFPRVLRG